MGRPPSLPIKAARAPVLFVICIEQVRKQVSARRRSRRLPGKCLQTLVRTKGTGTAAGATEDGERVYPLPGRIRLRLFQGSGNPVSSSVKERGQGSRYGAIALTPYFAIP